MRKAFSLSVKLLPVLILSTILVSYALFLKSEENFEHEEKNRFRKVAYTYVTGVLNNTKNWLLSQALMISHDAAVREAYIENNPLKIKEEFGLFWETLHDKFKVEEMHFFKYPNINFFSFSSFSIKPSAVLTRKDVEYVESAFKPAAYFFVCKRYPGLRASFPISYHGKIVGAVSFGISIERFKDILEKPVEGKVFYFLNKELMREKLDKNSFRSWMSKITAEDRKFYYFHTKETFPENYIQDGFLQKGHKFIIFYPLKDYKGDILGYIGISRDYSFLFNYIYKVGLLFTLTSIFVVVLVFSVCFGQVRYLESQKNTILALLDMIENRKFAKVDAFCKSYQTTGDAFDEIIKKIDLINKKMKEYLDAIYGKLKNASHKAFTDALTEVYNRHALETIGKTLKKGDSILMIDIDHFKKINDRYGHEIGDKVLKELAKSLKKWMRAKDKVFRYGGEEFVVVLPETSKENAKKLAERIKRYIEENEIEIGNGKKIKITASFGVAEKREGESLEDVIKRADEAMYRAKQAGRNRVSD